MNEKKLLQSDVIRQWLDTLSETGNSVSDDTNRRDTFQYVGIDSQASVSSMIKQLLI